jgi:Peptidase C13 family
MTFKVGLLALALLKPSHTTLWPGVSNGQEREKVHGRDYHMGNKSSRTTRVDGPQQLLVYVLAAVLAAVLLASAPVLAAERHAAPNAGFWDIVRILAGEDDPYEGIEDFDYEDAIYGQPALVAESLKSMQPSPPNRPQFYFVGVAPSSVQTVFRKEVASAREVFDKRFGTGGYSTMLINSFKTAAKTPMANLTNLDTVLKRIGALMDHDKDVLVLFITTHGAKEQLQVYFEDYPFNQIWPETLNTLLAEAGIRNRVVILSACHSGSFIPALANPQTLIMAAAHADKSSFGCSNQREWTYFGDALFNHAFRQTHNFEAAFAQADRLIAEWEAKDGSIPSNPQISVGSEIVKVLARMSPPEDQRAAVVIDELRK